MTAIQFVTKYSQLHYYTKTSILTFLEESSKVKLFKEILLTIIDRDKLPICFAEQITLEARGNKNASTREEEDVRGNLDNFYTLYKKIPLLDINGANIIKSVAAIASSRGLSPEEAQVIEHIFGQSSINEQVLEIMCEFFGVPIPIVPFKYKKSTIFSPDIRSKLIKHKTPQSVKGTLAVVPFKGRAELSYALEEKRLTCADGFDTRMSGILFPSEVACKVYLNDQNNPASEICELTYQKYQQPMKVITVRNVEKTKSSALVAILYPHETLLDMERGHKRALELFKENKKSLQTRVKIARVKRRFSSSIRTELLNFLKNKDSKRYLLFVRKDKDKRIIRYHQDNFTASTVSTFKVSGIYCESDGTLFASKTSDREDLHVDYMKNSVLKALYNCPFKNRVEYTVHKFSGHSVTVAEENLTVKD